MKAFLAALVVAVALAVAAACLLDMRARQTVELRDTEAGMRL